MKLNLYRSFNDSSLTSGFNSELMKLQKQVITLHETTLPFSCSNNNVTSNLIWHLIDLISNEIYFQDCILLPCNRVQVPR